MWLRGDREFVAFCNGWRGQRLAVITNKPIKELCTQPEKNWSSGRKFFWIEVHVACLAPNRDRKVAANEAAAKKLAEDVRTRNLGKELIASRIKMECWDSMEVQKKEVGHGDAGITYPFVVTNRRRAYK